ncbi:GAF domain-containing protein [Pleurocapsales cyanobacterium LEGE 10410]|nr:GAF domain-containing protein [Pleurocapsales cyanobacterium LEGE 10410]
MDSSSTYQEQTSNGATEASSPKSDLVQKIKKSLYKQERDRLWKVVKQVRQSAEQEEFFSNLVKVVQQEFVADRVLIYRFDSSDIGKVIAEALVPGWTPAMNETLSCNCFGALKAVDFQAQGYVAIEHPDSDRVTPYQKQLFEKFQIQASLALPILLDSFAQSSGYQLNQAWGLLVVQQCQQPRSWQEDEINLLYQLTVEITRVLQSPLLSSKTSAAKDLVSTMEQSMEQSMAEMLQELRHNLKADRALVYGFNPDGSGAILAESVDSMWKKGSNSFDNDCFITPDNCKSQYVCRDINDMDISPCFVEQIESLEAKAYIIVPIKSGDRLLGMLGIYQNSGTRNWQQTEVDLVVQSAPKFSSPLEQTSSIRDLKFKAKQAELITERDFLTSINQNAERMMQGWADKIRASMKVDRVAVCAFYPDWSGQILAESKGEKWQPIGSTLDYDFHFKGGEFEPYYVANDLQTKGLSISVLEKFEEIEAKAYIIVPIHANNQLMGVIGVYQNSTTRNWQESEITQLQGYATRFVKPLQQTAYFRNAEFQSKQMERAFKREKSLSKSLEKLRLSRDEKAVWQIATDKGREILDVDRVAIYRFNPDYSGNFVADSVAPGWSSLTKIIPFIEDTFLQNTKGGRYKNGETFSVEDIYTQGHKQCHVELLEQMQARAYALAPIFIADSDMFGSKRLWGLIGCYQNKGARRWQEFEVETLRQLGLQVGVAMQQINYTTTLKRQSKLDKTSSKISEQIRKAKNIDEVFEITTQEVNRALEVDRTIVYQFNEDFTGQVLAETIAGDWVSLLVAQKKDDDISSSRTENARCVLRKWGATDNITFNDTYMEETKGGKYTSEGKKYTVVDDIYTQKFPDCYIKSLERYQAKAYIIAPIFQDEKLWGLLGVYQNSGARNWQTMEAEQIAQLASQLGIAIQQIDYYEQLRVQSESLAETVAREKAAREELQKQALDILKTVRPAFSGDLTVRAKVTETEIGTVAGAYNTTLDSLKDIVEQVQTAASQVTETTGSSSSAIKGLSLQSERQLMELQEALDRVQSMIDASTVTTENAQKVEVAIELANQTVQTGDRAMNNTVDSIVSIRETVADAGKRVKRLSDSSQKISKVVSLISSFATQTNLLALNAALEATRAGEYGKGFAVVADEVRNLSLQSTEATTEIEKLVREIQEETKEVAAAMEAGVEQVAEGTNLVNETRDSLNEIVAATAEIKELVQGITSAANAQTQEAASVTQVMGQVAEIANETSQDSGKISVSFEQLEQLAQNLQSSVSKFKVK